MNGKGSVFFCIQSIIAMINLHADRESVIKNTLFLAINLLTFYVKHGGGKVVGNIRFKGQTSGKLSKVRQTEVIFGSSSTDILLHNRIVKTTLGVGVWRHGYSGGNGRLQLILVIVLFLINGNLIRLCTVPALKNTGGNFHDYSSRRILGILVSLQGKLYP